MDNNISTSPQDILKMLLEQASTTKQRAADARSFADRLRDERTAASEYMSGVAAKEFAAPGSVPMNPMDRMGRENAFLNAARGFAQPIQDYQTLAQESEGQYSDILTNLAKLAQDQSAAEPVSISDQLKAAEAGYEIVNGQLVKKDKSGEIPETDETIAVRLIDDILAGKTGGLTGLAKGKLSLSGLFSPLETAASKTNVEQLVGILSLAAAGKLKGTGAISDAERELLRKAASNLGINEKGETSLSDKEFRKRLQEIQVAMAKKSGIPELIERVSGKKQGYDENSLLDEMIGPTTTSSATRR